MGTCTLTGTLKHPNGTVNTREGVRIEPLSSITDDNGAVIYAGSFVVEPNPTGAFSIPLVAPGPGILPAAGQLGYRVSPSYGSGFKEFDLVPAEGDTTVKITDVSPIQPSPIATVDATQLRADINALSEDVVHDDQVGTTVAALDPTTGDVLDASGQPVEGATDTAVAAFVTSGEQTQAALAVQVTDPGTPVGAALVGEFVGSKSVSLLPPTLGRATFADRGDDPVFLDHWGGYMWGADHATGAILRSATEGDTWEPYCNSFNGPDKFLRRIVPTSDGEVLVLCDHGLFKSSGWAGGNTATWSASKVSSTGSGGIFNAFALDGDGTKFVLTEYGTPESGWVDSRYGYISTDAGMTWTRAWDSYSEVATSTTTGHPAWEPSTDYAVGDEVTNSVNDIACVLKCNQAGTSGTTAPAVAPSQLGLFFTEGGVRWQVFADRSKSHLHGCCYDPASDRFYISEGHNVQGGVYTSTDDGATWTRHPGMMPPRGPGVLNNGPTVLVATDDGLVMGSDNTQNGLFGVVRKDDPAEETMIQTWNFNSGHDGLSTFAERAYRDPATGIVYIGFNAQFTDVPLIIAAGTPYSGDLVYQLQTKPVVLGDRFRALAVTGPGRLVARLNVNSADQLMRGLLSQPGGQSIGRADAGHVIGGWATGGNTATAVGAAIASGLRTTAVGAQAQASAQDVTVVGYAAASTGGTNMTLVGSRATAASNSVAVGVDANAGNSGNTIAIGNNATSGTGGGQGVAIGFYSSARANCVAIGYQAKNTASIGSVAIGYQAQSGHQNAVALGSSVVTSADYQLALGARHIELRELDADPGIPATDNARLYVKNDGAGDTILCVRTAAGVKTVTMT